MQQCNGCLNDNNNYNNTNASDFLLNRFLSLTNIFPNKSHGQAGLGWGDSELYYATDPESPTCHQRPKFSILFSLFSFSAKNWSEVSGNCPRLPKTATDWLRSLLLYRLRSLEPFSGLDGMDGMGMGQKSLYALILRAPICVPNKAGSILQSLQFTPGQISSAILL